MTTEQSNVARATQASSRARARKPRGRSRPADIARWERDYKCVEMRRQGIDLVTIVEELGYSSTGHAHDRFVAFMREYPRDDVESMRDLELDRITVKMQQLESRCAEGDPRAVEVWNKLSERLAKLMGLDKPERREVTVLTDDVVQRSIREGEEQRDRKVVEARALGIEIPLELSPNGIYEPVPDSVPLRNVSGTE